VFQDGSVGTISSASCLRIFPQSSPWHGTLVKPATGRRSGVAAPPRERVPTAWTDADTRAKGGRPVARTVALPRSHWAQPLPFQQFQALFTLFSKYFASFPHGTCSLSVSCLYLALDGIYHPLSAALSSNTTRWKQAVRVGRGAHGIETLHDPPFQGSYTPASAGVAPVDYNSLEGIYTLSFSLFTRRY